MAAHQTTWCLHNVFHPKISGSFCKHALNHLTFLRDVRQALLQLISGWGSQGTANSGDFSLGLCWRQSGEEPQVPALARRWDALVGVLWPLTFRELPNCFPTAKSQARKGPLFLPLVCSGKPAVMEKGLTKPYSRGGSAMLGASGLDRLERVLDTEQSEGCQSPSDQKKRRCVSPG